MEGNTKFVVRVEDSRIQSWTGTDQHRNFKINDGTLSISFNTKNPANGEDLAVTVTSKRAE